MSDGNSEIGRNMGPTSGFDRGRVWRVLINRNGMIQQKGNVDKHQGIGLPSYLAWFLDIFSCGQHGGQDIDIVSSKASG